MTQIFLGYPPEHIKNWIIEHSQANPPTGNETWVPVCNPDGSPLTDTDHAEWVFSDGKEHTLTFGYYSDDMYIFNLDGSDSRYNHNGEEWIMGMPETFPKNEQPTKTEFYITNPNDENDSFYIKAYRKYIPGHWEDANGNWINGSWGDWSNSNLIEWSKPNYSYIDEDKWVYKPDPLDNSLIVYPSEYDQNANLCQHATAAELIATRTWTNTKPAPENQ